MRIEPQIEATTIKLAIDELKVRGINPEVVLKLAGISRSSIDGKGKRLPVRKFDEFIEYAAKISKDDCFGLHLGTNLNPKDLGYIAYVGLTSKTLRDAIQNLSRYVRVFDDQLWIELEEKDDFATIFLTSKSKDDYLACQANEASVGAILSIYRACAQRKLQPLLVTFLHPRLKNIKKFTEAFGCPVVFADESISIRLKVEDLDIPLISSDDKLLNLLKDICDDILQSRPSNRPPFLNEVERRIMAALPHGKARAKLIATDMGMSERTFLRRLSDSDETFQKLLMRLRKEVASEYLKLGELPITQVAFLTGYSDTGSFSSAFKRWTGINPSAYPKGTQALV